MTTMKRRKSKKRKQTEGKFFETLCYLKLERKKGTMANKTERKL